MKTSTIQAQVLLHNESGYVGIGYAVEVTVHEIERKEWAARIQVDLGGLVLTSWISEQDARGISPDQDLICVVVPEASRQMTRTELRLRALYLFDAVVIECYDTEQEAMDA